MPTARVKCETDSHRLIILAFLTFITMTTSNSSQLVTESSHTRIYISIFAVLIGFSVFRRIFQAAFSPLRKLPGPFLARFTRLWEVQANLKHEATTFNISLHERYGTTYSIAILFTIILTPISTMTLASSNIYRTHCASRTKQI